MLTRNVARKLTNEEIESYHGPIHYVPHHEIHKPESQSTPLRIAFNSSSSYMGHSLNSYWAKGPNVLNDLLHVLLRFRQEKIALAGDISKMYHTVKLSAIDQQTHRFLWRDMDVTRPPDHYALTSVPFGDRPSGAIAIGALRRTAEMCQTEYPHASRVILKDSYVDDILTSFESADKAGEIASEVNKVLNYGGFVIKHWIFSGNIDPNISDVKISSPETEKILGMTWKLTADELVFKVKLNFSPKIRGIHTGHDICPSNLDNTPTNLSRRMVLSQVAKLFDPLGLVTPCTLTGKLLMRGLCQDCQNQSWDTPLTEAQRLAWMSFFHDLFDIEQLQFPRCVKPPNAVGNPILVIFSDGSSQAYGACAYIYWTLSDKTFKSNLIMAKNRIAQVKQ